MQQQNEKLLNKEELAELLNVHENTIDRLRKEGVISEIKVSARAIRYSYSETIAQLKARKREA